MRRGRGAWGIRRVRVGRGGEERAERLGVAGEEVSWETGGLGRREGRGGEVRWWGGLVGVKGVSEMEVRGLRGVWVRGAVKELFVVGFGRRDMLLVVLGCVSEKSVCDFQKSIYVRSRSLLRRGYTVRGPRIVNCGAVEVSLKFFWHIYGI